MLTRLTHGVVKLIFKTPNFFCAMSRPGIFEALNDEMLDAYRQGVTEDERKQFEEWVGVAQVAGKATRRATLPETAASAPHTKQALPAPLRFVRITINRPSPVPPTHCVHRAMRRF